MDLQNHWFRRVIIVLLACCPVLCVNAQPGVALQQKIRAWKKSLSVTDEYQRRINVLNFPSGTIPENIWTTEVLPALADKDIEVRRSVAYIIGEKKFYPHVSIPALIRTLNDKSDTVATTAIFSLAAFGPKAVDPLFQLMQRNIPPYVSDYGETLEEYKEKNKDFLDKEWMEMHFFSRSGMRAMLSLRIIGDTALHYLSKYPSIKRYFKMYLLEGIIVSKDNFNLYYKHIKTIEELFDNYIEGGFHTHFIFDKLAASFSRNEGVALLSTKDTALATAFQKYLDGEIYQELKGEAPVEVVSEVVTTTLPDNLDHRFHFNVVFFTKLNKFSAFKDSFYLVRDSVASILKGNDFNDILFVLLANIGDSARSLYPLLVPYASSKSEDRRYLAIKAIINLHLRSNKTYVQLPFSMVYSPEMANEPNQRWHDYFRVSGEKTEGFGYAWWELDSYRRRYPGEFDVVGKLYFDSAFNPIKQNNRTLDTRDKEAVSIITSFVNDRDKRVRWYVAYALGLCDTATDEIKAALTTLLKDPILNVQMAASQSWTDIAASAKEVDAFNTVFTLENYFSQRLDSELSQLYDIDLQPLVREKGPSPPAALPVFPDPPPRPSVFGLATLKSMPGGNVTLDHIFQTLRNDLMQNKYYDLRTFSFMNGFALQTRMERLKPNGSIDFDNRYTRTKLRPKGFGEYFYQLFCGQPGYFRGAAFIVCSKPSLAPFGKELANEGLYDNLFDRGGSGLTSDIATRPFAGNRIHVLVYEYGKSADGIIKFTSSANARSIFDHFQTMNLSSFKLQ
ncbi:MAG TPA: HEAT repeat domain-containing protein [Chitinophagaceae bacterium]|nr:HEAT repeat domain-containing protein [Chitinophagaceae bacterium]